MHFKQGEKGVELRRELEEIFTEQECGGLECGTCSHAVGREGEEWRAGRDREIN